MTVKTSVWKQRMLSFLKHFFHSCRRGLLLDNKLVTNSNSFTFARYTQKTIAKIPRWHTFGGNRFRESGCVHLNRCHQSFIIPWIHCRCSKTSLSEYLKSMHPRDYLQQSCALNSWFQSPWLKNSYKAKRRLRAPVAKSLSHSWKTPLPCVTRAEASKQPIKSISLMK